MGLHICPDTLIMVVNCYRQRLLSLLLTNNILIKRCLDFLWLWQSLKNIFLVLLIIQLTLYDGIIYL